MKNISVEELVAMHLLLIAQTGGSQGVRDKGRLEAAVAVQTQNVFDQELYKTVYEKAAALTRAIIRDHPFVDGNKRTAILAGLTFLKINDQKFAAKKGEVEDFAVQIAVDRLDVQAIATWFEEHSC